MHFTQRVYFSEFVCSNCADGNCVNYFSDFSADYKYADLLTYLLTHSQKQKSGEDSQRGDAPVVLAVRNHDRTHRQPDECQ